MDNNVYKRHLFEVYSSDEEEIEDINELQVELLMGRVGSGQLPYPTRSIGSGRVTGQNGSEWVRRVLNLTN